MSNKLSIYHLKPKFQQLLRPSTQYLYHKGVTANQVTVFAMLVSVICALLVAIYMPYNHYIWLILPVWLLIRMALNAIDGMLAREFGQKSHLGGLLNELGDVVADAALFIPFIVISPNAIKWLIVGCMFVAFVTEFVGVCMQALGTERRYDGPCGKSDRAFILGCLSCVIVLLMQFNIELNIYLAGVFIIMLLLEIYTVYQRARYGLAALTAKYRPSDLQ